MINFIHCIVSIRTIIKVNIFGLKRMEKEKYNTYKDLM